MYPKGSGTNDFTVEELKRLTDAVNMLDPPIGLRPKLDQDYARCVEMHAHNHGIGGPVAWWHKGQVLVSVPGHDPEARLREGR